MQEVARQLFARSMQDLAGGVDSNGSESVAYDHLEYTAEAEEAEQLPGGFKAQRCAEIAAELYAVAANINGLAAFYAAIAANMQAATAAFQNGEMSLADFQQAQADARDQMATINQEMRDEQARAAALNREAAALGC